MFIKITDCLIGFSGVLCANPALRVQADDYNMGIGINPLVVNCLIRYQNSVQLMRWDRDHLLTIDLGSVKLYTDDVDIVVLIQTAAVTHCGTSW